MLGNFYAYSCYKVLRIEVVGVPNPKNRIGDG